MSVVLLEVIGYSSVTACEVCGGSVSLESGDVVSV